ncbi:NfeD family protein [Moraxella ovis]|uniref:NfeD family protein n=1 Tax=Moraxella ovis TaxID=29433 RepID=UPI000D9A9E28|nr:NfeD-like C-terminal, partner-binding [Moraxella ovis]STZ05964.1 NfeD-like C-terminal, partner-binding [Moraxella ovis]
MTIEPWYWLVFGVILVIAEMFVPTFFMLWFGAAAIIVALLSWLLGLSVTVSVLLWLVLSVLFCALWFKFIQPHIKNRTKAGLGGATIIGEIGIIIEPTDGTRGKIRFNIPQLGSSEWMCRTHDDEVIAVGERAVVKRIVGNELFVGKR